MRVVDLTLCCKKHAKGSKITSHILVEPIQRKLESSVTALGEVEPIRGNPYLMEPFGIVLGRLDPSGII